MSSQYQCQKVPGSFRDPSGFLFTRGQKLYRQVNHFYKDNYDNLIHSGLYETLAQAGLLIRHEEADISLAASEQAYKVIEPERIPFISYPYEWCFSQLKAAALATLQVQKTAMDYGMCLKDGSAYNIQFHKSRAVFIDTLSFESCREGSPWTAYGQFCRHFLAPLALMSRRDIRLGRLLRVYLDGVPLDLADKLLGWRGRLSFPLYVHVHLHAGAQKRYESRPVDMSRQKMSRFALRGLIDSLESAVKKLRWKAVSAGWADYYSDTNYSGEAFECKKVLVGALLDEAVPGTVWDLGANTGIFSRIAGEKGFETVSFDADPAAVEKNYLQAAERGESNILPLVLDLANPSAAIGWANRERMSLAGRGPADTALALALVHHLAISNNLPLAKIAKFFRDICKTLIVEFVPKEDSQVRRLLASREDIFFEYDRAHFEQSFGRYFSLEKCSEIEGTQRAIYLMRSLEE